MFPKLWRIFSSSFHSHLLPLFLEKKVSTFMLLGQFSLFSMDSFAISKSYSSLSMNWRRRFWDKIISRTEEQFSVKSRHI
ncbi:hypothetical protein Lepto1548_19210 [Leptospira interrogans serovar Bataviae]|nr:hypothetical protein Lepto1548_19210 [Leptospira interrogans serovar Bataviae]